MLKNIHKNKELVLRKPLEDQQLSTTPPKDAVLVLDFDISEVTLSRVNTLGRSRDDGSSLLFTFDDDSKLLLTDFYTAYTKDNMPTFMIEGVLIDGAEFFATLGEELMPAAGADNDSMGSGSVVGFLSTLIYDSNISSLDGLDATLTASVSSPELKKNTTEGSTIESTDTLIASAPTTTPLSTPFPLVPASILGGDGDMDRVVLTIDGSTIRPYPTNFAPFKHLILRQKDDINAINDTEVPFGESAYIVDAPQGGYFGIISVEGVSEQKTGEGIVFYVHNEYNKDVKLTLTWNASTGEYEARNEANNIFFSLVWDNNANTLTMEQYRLFTSIATSTTDNKNLDIQFGFVDANGKPLTDKTPVSFESIDDYVQYTVDGMDADHLDVTNKHDHEHVFIGNAEIGMQDSSLTLGDGNDYVEIHVKEKGMDAYKGNNTIDTGAGDDDVRILGNHIAMSSSDIIGDKENQNLILLGDGDDFLLIEGTFDGKNNIIDAGEGNDFIKLTHAGLSLEDVFVNSGEDVNGGDMDVLLLGASNHLNVLTALENQNITNTEIIIYGDAEALTHTTATSKDDLFTELGLAVNENGVQITDASKWTADTSQDITISSTGHNYRAYTYSDSDETDKHVTILIQMDSF